MTATRTTVGLVASPPLRPAAPSTPIRSARAPFWRRLLVVGLVALAVRVAYVVFVKRDDALAGDEGFFHLTANWLADGYGFTAAPGSGSPSALHPPLYSLLLAPVSWLAPGSGVLAQRLTGAVLGALTVIVIGYLGREVGGERVGIIAALIAAVSATLWVNDGVVMSESLAALLIALALLLTYRYARAPSIARAAALGAACGLAALTRGELVLLVVVVAAPATLLTGGNARQRARATLCALGTAALVLAPWVLYNLSRFEQPVYVSSNLGGVLCGANNRSTYYGSAIGLWDRAACPPPSRRPADQSVLNDFWTTVAIDYARDHPARLPVVAGARLGRIIGVYGPEQMVTFESHTGARPRAASWVAYGMWWLLLPAAVYGAIVLRRRRALIAPLVAMVGMVVAVATLLHGDVRYRLPADIAIIVFAAAGIDAVTRSRRRRSTRSTPPDAHDACADVPAARPPRPARGPSR